MPIRILIVEDEHLAAKRLSNLVLSLEPTAEIVASLDSVKKTLEWFEQNEVIDLMLLDIQLSDGLCFEIFSNKEITVPVIFTTAYDEFALKAFKLNSVDYLLKPIDESELKQALIKFKSQYALGNIALSNNQLKSITELLIKHPSNYKSRFLVKSGDRLEAISVNDIQYFFAEDKLSFIVTTNNKKFVMDDSLEVLEKQIDPQNFFRINRKFLARIESIEKIHAHLNGKLKVQLKGLEKEEIFVSRERATEFKEWLDR